MTQRTFNNNSIQVKFHYPVKEENYSCIEILQLSSITASSIQILHSENLNYTVWTSIEVCDTKTHGKVNQASQEKRNVTAEGGKYQPGNSYLSCNLFIVRTIFSSWQPGCSGLGAILILLNTYSASNDWYQQELHSIFQNTTYNISEEIRPNIPQSTKNCFESFTLHSLHLILKMEQMPTHLNTVMKTVKHSYSLLQNKKNPIKFRNCSGFE